MTLEEFDGAVVHSEGSSQVFMIRVAQHKTEMTERASVSCSGQLMEELKTWVRCRCFLIPESRLVFPKWDGAGPILDLTARVKSLGERLDLCRRDSHKEASQQGCPGGLPQDVQHSV